MVYYLTLNGKDVEYPRTLTRAKQIGKNLPKGKIKIEAYYGNKHGSGGALKYTLIYDKKSKKWIKTV